MAAENRFQISQKGIDMIAGFEGCRLTAYKCPAGVWTIGYGHTQGVHQGQTITEEQAKKMLAEDLRQYSKCVNDLINNKTIAFSVNQNQFDALTSFCYNCGSGSLRHLVKGRDAAAVAEHMTAYNKVNGAVLPGLDRRRKAEKKLFLS